MMKKKLLKTLTEVLVGVTLAAGFYKILCSCNESLALHQAEKRNRKQGAKRFCKDGIWLRGSDNAVFNRFGDRIGFLEYDWQDF